ncbi:MAG TPA: TonB-dependent receptor [Pyrinomonadaceae bacterium]|nr:TonB-dependent receptor [Pyrinomonadaceae bacterium]
MNVSTIFLRRGLSISLVVLLSIVFALGQQGRGTLRGVVKDELGGTVTGATVTLIDQSGAVKTATTNAEGAYVFSGLAPGKYSVSASAQGFAVTDEAEVDVAAGQRPTLDLTLKVTIEEQKVTVAAQTPISTDASDNANQTLITGKDLDALPDDPDELAAALQALAGPSMGPNGGQIFVDGFSGGRMPSKDSIREIRINQNPFSAENEQASGRIEILTRPGTDKLRGSTFVNFEDESLNSRNPFSDRRTPYQIRSFGGNLGGPIIQKKASFFVDFDRRETDDNELVRVSQLDANLNRFDSGFGVVVPRRHLGFGPRFDYQINPNNTLVARYNYNRSSTENAGVREFSLPERAFNTLFTNHTLTLTETAVLNASMINETRFQYSKNTSENIGPNAIPGLNVSGAFFSGDSQVGQALSSNSRWELQNFLAWQKGTHAIKFGGKVRGVSLSDTSTNNFGGTYVFSGGFVPTLNASNNPITSQPVFVDSLERYRRTLLGQRLGRTAEQIRAMGGGASQFSINSGSAQASVSQIDGGVYVQDDWRFRPNLTFGLGLRYENQTNINSKFNFGPRLFMAWSPGAANSTRPPTMVIRVGAGVFYNRFGEGNTLTANRFNGTTQQQFFVTERPVYQNVNGTLQFVPPVVPSPLDVFPNIPSAASLSLTPRLITWRVADDVQAPAVYVAGVQIERQLPYRFTMFTGFYSVHINHVVRARDINAPLPGSITALNPNGIRPLGNIGDVYQYESSGRFDQNQWFIGFNNRFNRTIQFSANYSLSKTQNDTDGQGGGLFPVNSYDFTGEYGRAAFDVRHRFNFFGTINLPWQVTVNPLVNYSSGRPFNIITGQDTNLDRQFTERPSFAPEGVDCGANRPANIICTPFGNFNRNPGPGELLIPRNFGEGPGFFAVNMRITKTWAFGSTASSRATAQRNAQQNTQQGTQANAARGGGPGGPPRIPSGGGGPGGGGPGGGGGQRGGGGPGGGGIGVPGGGGAEAKRYTMQFSVNFQNLFNKVNLANPTGSLSSPSFGESLSLQTQFGGFGGGSTGAGNRRVSAQVRFSF